MGAQSLICQAGLRQMRDVAKQCMLVICNIDARKTSEWANFVIPNDQEFDVDIPLMASEVFIYQLWAESMFLLHITVPIQPGPDKTDFIIIIIIIIII